MVLKLNFFWMLGVSLMLLACNNDSSSFDRPEEINASTPVSIEKAKSLYSMHCASCHGENGKLGLADAADLSKSTIDTSAVEKMISKGNDKGMIPYEDILSSNEIKGVAMFVLTLRK